MGIAFVCSCGRRFRVGDHLAGKAVQCNRCGARQRVPEPPPEPASVSDIYALDDEPEPVAPLPPPPDPIATIVTSGRRAAKGSRKQTRTGDEGPIRGFLEALPRGDDLNYPAAGVVALILGSVLAMVGGAGPAAFYIAVALAAVVCSLWAGGSAFAVAWRQGPLSTLTLAPALVATLGFYGTLLVPNPASKWPLGALRAAVFYAIFFGIKGRGKDYRRPIALGMLSTLLFLSVSAMIQISQSRPGGGIGLKSLGRAASGPSRTPPGSGLASGDPVARALQEKGSLVDARRGFRSKITRQTGVREPADVPPPQVFELARYPSPSGPLAAYLTPDPGDRRRHPAIVWITGGDCNSIGDVWTPTGPQNDQTAGAYREAGIIMMFPSLRGGNDNPGRKEAFLGEVDDVLAAADFLASQPYVDPQRIYLGGHSTGGTLALLVAESSDRFRAVFCFGPVDDVRGYGPEYCPFDASDEREVAVRSPGYWLHAVRSPTFVIEGERGNIDALRAMQRDSTNPKLHFLALTGAGHFDVLAPMNRTIAARILGDNGERTNIYLSPWEPNRPFGR